MKNALKKVTPRFVLEYVRKLKSLFLKPGLMGNTPKEIFNNIYKSNHWKGVTSVSGTGSDNSQTKIVIQSIDFLIKEFDIKSVLDLPCGDFTWMKRVNLNSVEYIGGDIVEGLIHDNSAKYGNQHRQFKLLDITKDGLPKCDIIIIRDCLVHLSYNDIYKALENVMSSGCTYLLTTTFTDHSLNYDIPTGNWRSLNLQKAPFHFPPPIKTFKENTTEGNGEYSDKSLALWNIQELMTYNSSVPFIKDKRRSRIVE